MHRRYTRGPYGALRLVRSDKLPGHAATQSEVKDNLAGLSPRPNVIRLQSPNLKWQSPLMRDLVSLPPLTCTTVKQINGGSPHFGDG